MWSAQRSARPAYERYDPRAGLPPDCVLGLVTGRRYRRLPWSAARVPTPPLIDKNRRSTRGSQTLSYSPPHGDDLLR